MRSLPSVGSCPLGFHSSGNDCLSSPTNNRETIQKISIPARLAGSARERLHHEQVRRLVPLATAGGRRSSTSSGRLIAEPLEAAALRKPHRVPAPRRARQLSIVINDP